VYSKYNRFGLIFYIYPTKNNYHTEHLLEKHISAYWLWLVHTSPTRRPWHAFQVMVILKHIFTKCCMLFHYSKPYQNIHSEVEANNNSNTTSKISSKILIQCFLFFFLLPPYPTHHQLSVTMLPQPTNQITLRKPIQWYSNKNDNLSPLISTNQSNPS